MFALHLFHCLNQNNIALSPAAPWEEGFIVLFLCGGWGRMGAGGRYKAIPHNSKCRYGERGTADAKPKAQIILDAAKVSAASGGNSEPKQGQRSQSARGFCPRSTMRVPQPDIIEHFGNADAVPQLPERCLSRKAGIVRCCHKLRIHGVGRAGTTTVFPQAVFALCDSTKTLRCLVPASRAGRFKNEKNRGKNDENKTRTQDAIYPAVF